MHAISLITTLCIVICQLLESYAYYLKGTNHPDFNRQLVGLANWVQYVARINYVIVLFLLSYTFEVLNNSSEAIHSIVIGFAISFVLSLTVLLSSRFRRVLNFFLSPLIYFTYKDLISFSVGISFSDFKFRKSFFISLISSILLGVAFVLPFLLASNYPSYRMMATYSGQFVNFFATAMTIAMLEPIIYKELDKGFYDGHICNSAKNVILAKMSSQIILFAVLLNVL